LYTDEAFDEERVRVFITLQPNANLTLADLQAFCKPRMSRYMIPSELVVLAKMPCTPTGKPAKTELRNYDK